MKKLIIICCLLFSVTAMAQRPTIKSDLKFPSGSREMYTTSLDVSGITGACVPLLVSMSYYLDDGIEEYDIDLGYIFGDKEFAINKGSQIKFVLKDGTEITLTDEIGGYEKSKMAFGSYAITIPKLETISQKGIKSLVFDTSEGSQVANLTYDFLSGKLSMLYIVVRDYLRANPN